MTREVRYISHEDALREAKRDWRFRFWYTVLRPKYWLIKLWLRLRHGWGQEKP